MSPDEVIKLFRQHALELIEFHEKMSVFTRISQDESIVILNLCLYLIEELAENRWLTSDIIEQYEAGEPPVFIPNKNLFKGSALENSDQVEQPPFDQGFFLNLPEI